MDHDMTPYGWVEEHMDAEEVVITDKDIWKSAQSDIWDEFSERERRHGSIDMERLNRLQESGWVTVPQR
jgi:hypothetical protein